MVNTAQWSTPPTTTHHPTTPTHLQYGPPPLWQPGQWRRRLQASRCRHLPSHWDEQVPSGRAQHAHRNPRNDTQHGGVDTHRSQLASKALERVELGTLGTRTEWGAIEWSVRRRVFCCFLVSLDIISCYNCIQMFVEYVMCWCKNAIPAVSVCLSCLSCLSCLHAPSCGRDEDASHLFEDVKVALCELGCYVGEVCIGERDCLVKLCDAVSLVEAPAPGHLRGACDDDDDVVVVVMMVMMVVRVVMVV